MPGALDALKKMITAAKKKASTKGKAKWEFRASPHAQFNKTLDDTFEAFLMWARSVPPDAAGAATNGGSKRTDGRINVSRAFRRLETYAAWMAATGEVCARLRLALAGRPLTPEVAVALTPSARPTLSPSAPLPAGCCLRSSSHRRCMPLPSSMLSRCGRCALATTRMGTSPGGLTLRSLSQLGSRL